MGFFKKKRVLSFEDNEVQAHIRGALGEYENVYHAPVPFQMGHEIGGRSDVYIFDKQTHVNGYAYVTGDLIGEKQKKSDSGNYELMICHKDKETDWGVSLVSELAYYTLQASLNSGETMSLENGPYGSDEYTIKCLLFHKYAEFIIETKKIGLMLLMGITQKEWEWGQENGTEKLIEILKDKKIYPFTDLYRKSVI